MNINDITQKAGKHRRRKRLGRGESSGHGKTCGRGTKGSYSRAGGTIRRLTEGGQMPLFRRLPKRGFNNANFTQRFAVVNVGDLDKSFSDGQVVNREALDASGLVRERTLPVKILGDGALAKKLVIEAAKFSKTALAKIKAAGGEAKTIK